MRWGWNEICPPEALLTGPGAVSWSGQGFPRTARQPRSWGGAGWSPPPRGPQGQGSVPTVSLRLAAPAWEAELTRLDGGEGGAAGAWSTPTQALLRSVCVNFPTFKDLSSHLTIYVEMIIPHCR